MRIEAAILDRHHGPRNVGRHLVQADGLAAGHATVRKQPAVDRNDLDVGRAVRDRPRRRGRHLGAVVDHDAGGGDAAPDRQHEGPVEQLAQPAEHAGLAAAAARLARPFRCRLAAGAFCLRTGDDAVVLGHRQPAGFRPCRRLECWLDAPVITFRHEAAIPVPGSGLGVKAKCGNLRWG